MTLYLKHCHVQIIELELQLTSRVEKIEHFSAIHARIQSSHWILLMKSIKHARHDSTTHNPNCQIESAIGRAVSDEKDKTLKRWMYVIKSGFISGLIVFPLSFFLFVLNYFPSPNIFHRLKENVQIHVI